MKRDYDVIVVGAGPGGATAARTCAQAGLRTLLIEKERLPRYKPCAGCLSIRTVRFLGFDLDPVVEHAVTGAKFTYSMKDPFFIRSLRPIALMVVRDRFDHFLVQKALEGGAEISEGERVVKVARGEEGVEVTLAQGGKIYGEYLVGADGAGSMVAKLISYIQPKGGGDGIGLESKTPLEVVTAFPREELEVIHFDFGRVPYGYGWVFPKGKWLSIGIGGVFKGKKKTPRQHFKELLNGLDFISEGSLGKVLGHPVPFFYSDGQKVSQGKILLVGDAAHLIDPLSGEGIYYALRSGTLAAEAILQSRESGTEASDTYQKAVKGLLFDDLKWALNISKFIYRFPKLAYQTLKHYPELGNMYARVLGGEETYQGFVARVKDQARDLLKGRLNAKTRKVLTQP
jgi:geranylgeranyl reductase family protein